MPIASRVIDANDYPTAGCECLGSDLNELQDKGIMLLPGTGQQQATLPTTFRGATWIVGEFTILAGMDVEVDTTRDWRNCQVLGFLVYATAANELPSGANHAPDVFTVDHRGFLNYNLKDGDSGAHGAGTHAWHPWVAAAVDNIWFYASDADGHLLITNDEAGTAYVYLCVMLTPPIM